MIIFGMIVMFAGIALLCIGWNSVPKNSKSLSSGALLAFGGTFVAIGRSPSRDMPNGSTAMVTVGIMLMVCGAALVYTMKKSSDAQKAVLKDRLLELGGTPLDRFFVECVLSSCNDFSLEKNVAKAKLLADKYKLAYPNGIEALYSEGLKAHEAVSQKLIFLDLSKQKDAEKVQYERLNLYSNLYGKDKPIAMLTDRMNELNRSADSLSQGADMLMRSTQQKERDWAAWGGTASGIAGAGAGIATALDIQAQNAQIRVQNEANMRAAMPAYMAVTGSASDNRKNAESIKHQIELVNEKLISDEPADEVFKKLEIITPSVEVSDIGAFKVTATITVPDALFIYDDVAAVMDGTIIAHVVEDGAEIGTANLVLPVNGVETKTGVSGMALSGAHKEKQQTVTFSEGPLWLIEK